MNASILSVFLGAAVCAAAAPSPRTAVVTGAASGIGRAIAQEAAARGWRVVLADKDHKGARKAALEIREKGGTALALEADVSVDAERARILEEAVKEFGGVDLLVNNAGYGYMAATERVSLEEARRQFEVNYFAVVDLSRRAIPLMKKPRGGTVVQVASVLGVMPGLPENGQYAASKHALVGWARSSEAEFRRLGIRLKVALPAGTRTRFFKNMAGPDAGKVETLTADLWEDFDSAEKVASDILDGAEAEGIFIFPGRAREALSPEQVRLLGG